jgi:hypothetical protein
MLKYDIALELIIHKHYLHKVSLKIIYNSFIFGTCKLFQ